MIRVIVADDEYKICQLICSLIKWDELDMQLVGTAANGVEALEMIEKEKPDLVLTDIRMPGYDGLELLKRARQIDSNVEFIIISGYSHFEYAQTAIHCGVSDYILKPINQDSLNATLQKVSCRYRERQSKDAANQLQAKQKEADVAKLRTTLWTDILSGHIAMDRDSINEKYYYDFKEGICRTFLVIPGVLDNKDIEESGTDTIPDLLYSKTLLYLQKYAQPLCVEMEVFYREGQIHGIVNYLSEREEQIEEAFKKVIDSVSTDLSAFENLQFYLGMGTPFSSLEECICKYAMADRAAGQRLFVEEENFFVHMPAEAVHEEDTLYQSFNREINQALDIKSGGQVGEAVERLQVKALSCELAGFQVLELIRGAYHLFLLSSIFHSEFHFEDREKREADFNKRALLCSSVNNLFLFLKKNCIEALDEACQWIDRERIRPISQAKQYIQEHYAEVLSLENVSSQVAFSPSYFSTLFRKETGKTFVEYVTEVRIEEAKKLLRESHVNIELISTMVGCNDSKRFSKTFKKAMGISQKDYRKLYS